MNEYYTYAYLREDRTPYYIGKGKKYRAFQKRRCGAKPPKNRKRIIFLKQNLTEEEAFKHEVYMISIFGRKDLGTGILLNRSDGGEGSSGWIATPELRKRMSEYRNGKKLKPLSQETKQKLREINLGKTHSDESKLKMSKSRKGKKRNPHSTETRKKISLANQGVFNGQKNPMYGKNHNKNSLDLMSSKAKTRADKKYSNYYEFISPFGDKIIEFTTILDFCKKHNLRADCMRKVILGQRKSHKGWTGKKINEKTTD
jgi:hypothetical protein